MNKIFAIGDIHGCFDKLQRLILEIKADPVNDTLVFIGDYIDRADGGRDVVDYILKLKKTFQNVICLRGNHESMLLRFLDGVEDDIYLANGGFATLKAYGISRSDAPKVRKKKIPPDHLKFFKTLLPYYETDQFIFVHAGLIPGRELNEQSLYDMQWIRQTFIDSDDDFGKRVVFGHTHFSEPLVEDNKIGIDTGAVYGGSLTCVELPALKFYQV
ncbi:MAG: Serine/threonine-protein phosphatase 1 [Deltaproteobacteria bacterium ADurb.Bin151]|jgi:serine/threonine protein phosphatase 1|nr:serine/threonine protein phosphatase [Smithella sp.]OQB55047.1 MAG: Serine/threonine-protein phosphatase 1 [Deltaproteobacteria bacterium ADurb.Bin151]HOQ41804.1 metallophosphoesterase family protein [Smithellaceae bacterium]HPL66337.1 metallophosphoesterase family protein [Smithellaceae bacterium]HRY35696.1 metallophosphoesterase family protein [Smithellaceae bacterium]